MLVLNLSYSAPPVCLQNVLVDANRVFVHAACRKPLLHLAAACTAEVLSQPFIVDEPQHHSGKLPAIGLRDQRGSFTIHNLTERSAICRNARQSRSNHSLLSGY